MNARRISVNDAYLDLFANPTNWADAFLSLGYSDTNVFNIGLPGGPGGRSGIRKEYSGYNSVNRSCCPVEQAYITFYKPTMWPNYKSKVSADHVHGPFFIRIGKQFSNFGRYHRNPMTRPMTQVMTESLHTQVQVGVNHWRGINASVAAFNSTVKKRSEAHTAANWIYSLGYDDHRSAIGFDVGVQYMHNWLGVNDMASLITQFNTSSPALPPSPLYQTRVSAYSYYADINVGRFDFEGRYVAATSNFFVTNTGFPIVPSDLVRSGVNVTPLLKANPWALDLVAAYHFYKHGKKQRAYFGYGKSNQAVRLSMPRSQFRVGYGIDAWRNVSLAAELVRNCDYKVDNGGTESTSNTVVFRVCTKFGV
jgi:hypothetical protein